MKPVLSLLIAAAVFASGSAFAGQKTKERKIVAETQTVNVMAAAPRTPAKTAIMLDNRGQVIAVLPATSR